MSRAASFQVQTTLSPATDLAAFRSERIGIDFVLLGDEIEDLPEGIQCGPAVGAADAAHGRAPAGRTGARILARADVDLHHFQRNAEGLGEHDGDDRPRARADVLAAGGGFHRAVGIDLHGAGSGMSPAAPGVQSHAEAAFHAPFALAFPVGMPVLLPVDELGRDFHLGLIDVRLAGSGRGSS